MNKLKIKSFDEWLVEKYGHPKKDAIGGFNVVWLENAFKAGQESMRPLIKKLEEENNWLLEVVKKTYRKHHMGDDSIGWSELSDILLDALCNYLGDDGYQKWIKELENE